MAKEAAKVQTRHPEPGKVMPRIAKTKYDAVRRAILRAVPRSRRGIPFQELPRRVADLLPGQTRATLGSVGWYTTTIKLDLEARGEIERVPGVRPQHLRRKTSR
jgi:hypothetical protein